MVKAGQPLLAIDDRDIIQKVKAAEAGHRESLKALETAKQNRALAEITYARYKKMADAKAISRQEMDQMETQNKIAALEYERIQETVDRAAAGLSEAGVYLGFTRIYAPAAGMITEKKIDVGSMAAPGMPLFTLEDTSAFQAEITLDESLSGKFKPGMPALVFIEALKRPFKGRIREILPAIDTLSRSFTVKIALAGAPGLRTGLYAQARIPAGAKEVILAPLQALVVKGQLTGVYAVDDRGVIAYRLVRTGKTYGNSVEILSGLVGKDRIIVQGVEKAVDGGIMETGKM
jgi:RND family efflux transporter MFP subunit